MSNILRGISHTLAAVTSNCSEFEQAWRNSHRSAEESHWLGEWRSDVNRHHGALRCLLKTVAANEFRAYVRARYGKIMRVCYTVDLRFEKVAEQIQLVGEADLGELAGGIYRYEGTLTAATFECRYECKYDRGAFSLRQVNKGAEATALPINQ